MPDAISTVGSSGLDINAIADALTNADIAPAQSRLVRQQNSLNTRLSSLGLVKSALDKLQANLSKFSSSSLFNAKLVNVSDSSSLIVSPSETASTGSYQIQINQLATKQNLAAQAVADTTSSIGNGTITIEFGTYNSDNTAFTTNPDKVATTITIQPGQDSLTAIRDAINAKGSGVQASIVKDTQGYRLTLSAPQTGEDYAMRINVSDSDGTDTDASGLSFLAYDPTTGVNNVTQTIAAENSEVVLNGLLLSQSSNQLKDTIPDVTLDLKKAQPGTIIYVNINDDQSKLTSQIKDFVQQYNETLTTINNLTSYDPVTKKSGNLQSDSGVRELQNALNRIITQNIHPNASIQSLADIGIKHDNKGLLTLDGQVLNNAIQNHYDEIGALFGQSATASDNNIQIRNVPGDIKAGTYAVNLSTYNPGVELSGTIGNYVGNSTDGTTLTGSGDLSGLTIGVLGGSTGNRGTITVSDGLATQLGKLLDRYLGAKGNLTVNTTQLNQRLDDLKEQQTQINQRAELLHARYKQQFGKLDAILSRMQSLSGLLAQDLDRLNKL